MTQLKKAVETLLIIGLTFLVGQAVFLDWFHDYLGNIANCYWMFLLITWTALRLETLWVLLVLFIISLQSLPEFHHKLGITHHNFPLNHSTDYIGYVISLAIVGITLSIHITAEKSAKQSQQQAIYRLEKLTEHLPGVVFQYKTKADGSGFFPYMSSAVTDIFRLRPEQVRENCDLLVALIHPDDYASVVYSIQQAQYYLMFWCCEFRIRFEDGSVFWLMANATPEAEDNSVTLWHGFIKDITKRKQTEQVLKTSEERFRSIINSVPVPMALNDENQQIVFLNPAFIKTFGYHLTDIPTLETWWTKAYPNPEYQQAVKQSWQAAIMQAEQDNKDFTPIETSIQCKNAEYKTVLVSAANFDHSFSRLRLVVLYDVTELRESQRELTNNKHFTALIEAIPDAIFLKDGQGRWLIINQTAKQLFQLDKIAWYGKTDLELAQLQPEFQDVYQGCATSDERAWQARKLSVIPETIVIDDNQKLEYEVRKVPIFDAQWQRQGLVIIGRDMTESDRKEEQLYKLAQVVEQNPESIMITNLKSEIEYVNPAFTKITGYSSAEVLGKKPSILKSGKTLAKTYAEMWEILSQGLTWKGELINQLKDGSETTEFTIISPLRQPDGQITHYIAVQEDISAKKVLQHELEQHRHHLEELVEQRTSELNIAKNQAETASQTKSEFLANMSHEIRTPMNAVLGFSDILSDLITDSTQRHYLSAIKSSGQTLLQLINDILDLSKIEAGKLDLNYCSVKINAIFADLSIIFMQKMTEKNIHLNVEIAENMPAYLLLDEIRLRQVLLNTIGNAVKFTSQGFIRVNVVAKPTSSTQYLDLLIEIEDSGMGIASDQVEYIFSAFTQQKNQSYQYGGTGLGLTICKRLVEMMGGKISVSSQLGQGSCFSINLPQVEICNQAAAHIADANLLATKEGHFQAAMLLLVDDIESNRLLIKSYLQDYPELELIETESGEQALELTQHHHFDLIFMDRRLPDENGDSVCQKIKAMPEYADIPIIMITASALTLTEQQTAPFYDLTLHKPVKKAELLSSMQMFLPLDESIEVITAANQPEKFHLTACDCKGGLKNKAKLVELLTSGYQAQIIQLSQASIFEIDTLIDTAEQLIQIAEQYHCNLLADWANTLKTQSKLFDIRNLTKTLTRFEELLAQLRK